MTMKLQKVKTRDIETSYIDTGSGPPLLMIMGMAGIIEYWVLNNLRNLSSSFRVIAYNNRGMGETSSGSAPFSMEEFARDALELMNALAIDRAHVLGWSMGSSVAQELVLRNPERVDRLVLYGSSCGGKEAIHAPKEILKKLFDTESSPKKLTEFALQLMVPSWWLEENPSFARGFLSRPMSVYLKNLPAVRKQIKAIKEWPGSYNRLSEIKNRTLVITGDEDIVIPPENSSLLAEMIENSSLKTVKGGGHGMLYQYPDLFVDMVTSFLKE